MANFQVIPTAQIQDENLNQKYPFHPMVSYKDGFRYILCGVFSVADGEKVIRGWKRSARKSICAKELLRD